ncbi:cytokine-inducible SH2-containing protein [Anopheles bellator]|uniref:cytokine-inducible SH2-containing protein n=1 Tax=Anopheles bellator TaxID=139047 RepID=UPI002647EF35|nr:cytokine-inducible SH2-containing protein [Anopheles bellator]
MELHEEPVLDALSGHKRADMQQNSVSTTDTDGIYRFNWFLSLRRKSSPQTTVATGSKKNEGDAGSTKDELFTGDDGGGGAGHHHAPHGGSVFYTLRKRFQKKFTSVKVKAYEPDGSPGTVCLASSCTANTPSSGGNSIAQCNGSSAHDSGACLAGNDFARIVIERHTQNPIRFSANLPVIMNRDIVPNMAGHERAGGGDPAPLDTPDGCRSTLDDTMSRMRIDLLQYGWYWGKLTRSSAQKRLARQCNGTFLVRDSQTEKYQFTVSFRSSGITLHCRIDYKNNYWSFSGLTTPTTYETMIELIEDTMKKSEFGVIGYVKQNSPLMPPFPVRLTKPINRFYEVSTLQHLCRFIIRQKIDSNDIAKLPLPEKLKQYVEENFYDL